MRADCYGKLGEALTSNATSLEATKTGKPRWSVDLAKIDLKGQVVDGETVNVTCQKVGRGCYRFSFASNVEALALTMATLREANKAKNLDGQVASAIQRGAKTFTEAIVAEVDAANRRAKEIDLTAFDASAFAEPTDEVEPVAEPEPEQEPEPVAEPVTEPVAETAPATPRRTRRARK